jgi:pyridoxamine 5'-phosphate oxidase
MTEGNNSGVYESVSGRTRLAFEAYERPPREPIQLAQQWIRDAEETGAREPRAMVLSTVSGGGELTSRVMAILGFDEGPSFATHRCSRKIRDIEEHSHAVGFFYWREMGRQLSVSGQVIERPRWIAEDVWKSRPVPLHAMSMASHQSEILQSPQALRQAATQLEAAGALPCPDRFAVYVLRPVAVEFWSVRPDRMHFRLRYTQRDGTWTWARLQP